MNIDYYQILGLPSDASEEEIRRNYRGLVKKYHPDVLRNPYRKTKFLNIQDAYEVLSSPDKKKRYDLTLKNEITNPLCILEINSQLIFHSKNEIQKYYSLIILKTNNKQNEQLLMPIHLSIVLDTSTSMHGNRISLAKKNIKAVFEKLSDNDFFSLVVFNDYAHVLIEKVQKKKISDINKVLNDINTQGSTEIYRGLTSGINCFDFIDDIQRYLVLLTDGMTYGDEKKCVDKIKKISMTGAIFDAYGFGSDWNEVFLEELTSITGGNVIYVNNESVIEEKFCSRIDRRNEISVKNINIKFNWNKNFKCVAIFNNKPDCTIYPSICNINLGNLYSNENIEILFEFIVDPNINSNNYFEIGRGEVNYYSPQYRKYFRKYIDITYNKQAEISHNKYQILVDAVKNLTLYHMLENAEKEANRGNFATAHQKIENLVAKLNESKNYELQKQLLEETKIILNNQNYSDSSRKIIRYNTRFLLSNHQYGDQDL